MKNCLVTNEAEGEHCQSLKSEVHNTSLVYVLIYTSNFVLPYQEQTQNGMRNLHVDDQTTVPPSSDIPLLMLYRHTKKVTLIYRNAESYCWIVLIFYCDH